MSKIIECDVCGREVKRRYGTQRTCLEDKCRAELTRRTRNASYHRRKPKKDAPICVWCNEPVLEFRKRKYHTKCRAEKNRQRVKEYNKNRPKTSTSGPKRPRVYKDHLVCKYCKKKVKRTAARQFTCSARKCQRARKREAKERSQARKDQRARAEQREQQTYLRRLEQVRAEKIRRFRESRPPTSEREPTSYRVAL